MFSEVYLCNIFLATKLWASVRYVKKKELAHSPGRGGGGGGGGGGSKNPAFHTASPHLQRYPMLALLMTSHGSSGSCGFKQGTGCSGGLRAITPQMQEVSGSVRTQAEGRKGGKRRRNTRLRGWRQRQEGKEVVLEEQKLVEEFLHTNEKTKTVKGKRDWFQVFLDYHSPGWKTVYLHWRHSFQCLRESAGWTSWSGGGASEAACTWPSPSAPPSADRSQSGCRWSSLSGQIGTNSIFQNMLVYRMVFGNMQPHLPTTCGSVEASRSSRMVPFSMHVLSSIKLCKDSVATWGLLQRSPPFSTFSSNLIHLDRGGKRFRELDIFFTTVLDLANKCGISAKSPYTRVCIIFFFFFPFPLSVKFLKGHCII